MPLGFKSISSAARLKILPILRRLLPDGKVQGNEFIARNPTRSDKHPGSFKINLRTGRWSDFATGDSGGDVISLVAYLEGMTQAKAARLVAGLLGIGGDDGQ